MNLLFFILLSVCLFENGIHSKSTPVEKQRPSWKTNMGKRAHQSLKSLGDILNREKRNSAKHRRGGGRGGGGGWGDDDSSSEEDFRNFYNPYMGYNNNGYQGYPYPYPGYSAAGYSTPYPGYPVPYPGYSTQYPGYPTQYPTFPTAYPGYSTQYPTFPTAYPGYPYYSTTTARPTYYYNFTIPPIFARSPLKKQDDDLKSTKFEDVKHDLYGNDTDKEKPKNILNHAPQKFAHDSNGNKLEIIHASFSKPGNAALTIKSEPTINTASFRNQRIPNFPHYFAQGPPPGMGQQGPFPGKFPGNFPDNPGNPQNSFPPFMNATVFNLTQAVPDIFNIFNSSFNPFPNFPEMSRSFQNDHTNQFGGLNGGHRDHYPKQHDFQMPNLTQIFNNPLNFSIPGFLNVTAMIPSIPFPIRPSQ